MSPKLALILCILLVLYLFILDIRRKPEVSNALWLPLIWLMICGSRLPFQWLLGGSITTLESVDINYYENGNPVDRAFFSSFILIGIFVLLKRKLDWPQLVKNNIWILLLFLYFLITILWSEFIDISFKRWIKTTGNIIMVMVVLSENNQVEAIKTLFKRCSIVLIPFSIVIIKYYRHWGVFYSVWGGDANLGGVTLGKNQLARICFICGLFLFWNLYSMWHGDSKAMDRKDILIHLSLLSMIGWLMSKSHSATSMLSLMIGICSLIFLNSNIVKGNIKNLRVYFLLLFGFFAIILYSFDSIFLSIVETTGHAKTFLGRTGLWEDLIKMNIHPFLGFGYESFWLGQRLTILWGKYWWMPNEAHNGYLELYIQVGLVGLFLLILVIFNSFRNIERGLNKDFQFGAIRLTALITILIYNITEATFKGLIPLWFVFLLISIDVRSSVLYHNDHKMVA